MAELSDLSWRERAWYHTYRFRRAATGTAFAIRIPLRDARIALLTSAGLHLPADEPFREEKGGDWSYRVIPSPVAVEQLKCTHPSDAWDRSGVAADANVALPLDRLHELAADGRIGSVAADHISIQGSITAPGRLVHSTLPEVVERFTRDRVDGLILAPV